MITKELITQKLNEMGIVLPEFFEEKVFPTTMCEYLVTDAYGRILRGSTFITDGDKTVLPTFKQPSRNPDFNEQFLKAVRATYLLSFSWEKKEGKLQAKLTHLHFTPYAFNLFCVLESFQKGELDLEGQNFLVISRVKQ